MYICLLLYICIPGSEYKVKRICSHCFFDRYYLISLSHVHIYRLVFNHHIIILVDGIHGNVIKIKPPMCFTRENSCRLVEALDSELTSLEAELSWEQGSFPPSLNCWAVVTVSSIIHMQSHFHFAVLVCGSVVQNNAKLVTAIIPCIILHTALLLWLRVCFKPGP